MTVPKAMTAGKNELPLYGAGGGWKIPVDTYDRMSDPDTRSLHTHRLVWIPNADPKRISKSCGI